ncbi:glycine, alanine and asparagine-rich protein-like [Rhagoletis pomonella]|uniref:glycine, alanine and asparagine-rich protein-like n=1 Tax=Rhagoletis pomonella TaxID=28610 RepID=UPI001783C849|nr:glycine, alanine and asparagine-rich protein-like [Rhagoletis pomonella]XP_036320278.1 glycine, alanine and asparagine-rich protein-like [Rhagoletis pomonella]
MRLFLVLCCSLAAIAHAKPQGYNYGTGISGGSANVGRYQSSGNFAGGLSGLGSVSGAPIGGGSSSSYGGFGSASNSAPSFGSASNSAPSFGHYQSGSNGISGGGGFGSGISGGFSGIGGSSFNAGFGGRQQSGGFEAPLVHKQFITVSAPEDHESLEQSKHFVIGRPQKNYRVVFIKAPSSSSANVKLSAEYAPQEEKTVIYVLSKKDSTLEVNDIATPAPTVPAKPEVFFIKYKTEEEAHHAQQQIQDTLGS